MSNSSYRTALSGAALALMLIAAAACGDDSSTGSADAGTTPSGGATNTTAGAVTATSAAAPTKAPLKLGWVGTVSGPAAPTGQQTQGAVKAWEQSVNARG